MKTDIQIAREARLERINVIAERMGIPADDVYNYGPYMAKVPLKQRFFWQVNLPDSII